MIKEEWKEKYNENLLIEAEIHSVWPPFEKLKNKKIADFERAIIFKLKQAHYHYVLSIRYGKAAREETNKSYWLDKRYYDFLVTCNVDSMIYALNSIMDIILKFIIEVYPDIKLESNHFVDLCSKENNDLEKIKMKSPNIGKIIKSFFSMPEREYVRNYCNDNKHVKAFYSAKTCTIIDVEKLINPTDKEPDNDFIQQDYYLKQEYRKDGNNRSLTKYSPRLFKIHLKKINELGRSILESLNLSERKFDENLVKYIKMTSYEYYR